MTAIDPNTRGNINTGAVAFLDALGFKGIWERSSPAEVLAKLDLLQIAYRRWVPSAQTLMPEGHVTILSKASFLSDTIIVTAWCPSQIDPDLALFGKWHCLLHVVLAANILQHSALIGRPSLTYRGVVTVGDFLVSDVGDQIVGPAVDEAAEKERLADGPFVWLTDTAEDLLKRLDSVEWFRVFRELFGDQLPLLEHDLPFRDGSTGKRHVILPFSNVPIGPPARSLCATALESFAPETESILRKRRNAATWFEHALQFLEANPWRP